MKQRVVFTVICFRDASVWYGYTWVAWIVGSRYVLNGVENCSCRGCKSEEGAKRQCDRYFAKRNRNPRLDDTSVPEFVDGYANDTDKLLAESLNEYAKTVVK